MDKYRAAALLVLVSAAVSVTACNDQKTSSADSVSGHNSKTVTDQTGAEVSIPEKIDTVVSGGILPYFHTWYVATRSTKEIAGMHPNSYNAAKHSMLAKISPDVLKASTSFVQNGEVNVEELMKINPDVYFELSTDEKSVEQTRNAGINTVAVKAIDAADADPVATFGSWLVLTGQIAGTPDRAGKFLKTAETVQNEINEKIRNLKKEQKPNAMVLHRHSDKTIVVGGKNFFGNKWLAKTGANDVAENDVTGMKEVNMEQVYKWNPEIIYITNFTETQPEDLYNNAVKGQDWSQIEAVKKKQVYKIPLGIYRWFPPSGDAPLMLKWLANHNQPALFAYDMDKEIKNYYKDFYRYDVSSAEIRQILRPSSEAAKY